MTWLKENWFKIPFAILVILILGSSFYWFEVRPIKIRKTCWDWAFEETGRRNGDREDVNYLYKKCFRQLGLPDDF